MTFVLGKTSRLHLQGVHPDLVACVERAIQITVVDFTVMEGLRSLAQQRRNLARGVSRTLNSKHLVQPDGYGHAVDLVPWIDGAAKWDWPGCYAVAAAMRLAGGDHGVSLRWGGTWGPMSAIAGGSAAAMEFAHTDYVRAWEAAHPGKRALQDGPHFELLKDA